MLPGIVINAKERCQAKFGLCNKLGCIKEVKEGTGE
jgi:hypothetical protein